MTPEEQRIMDKLRLSKTNEYVALSYYLAQYDRVAWVSSDLVMQEPKDIISKMGREWFCFEDSLNRWHAIYGNYSFGSYTPLLHYVMDSVLTDLKKTDIVKESFFNDYAEVIKRGYEELEKDSVNMNMRYNHFIKMDSLKNISIWFFPGIQQENKAVYGCEYYYKFDPKVETILEKNIVKGPLMYNVLDETKKIYLHYEKYETPPLQAIFYAVYFKKYFAEINIVTKDMLCTIIGNFIVSVPLSELKDKPINK
ncbi:MAG: hypothetical protein WCR42_10015 [bacterium]